MVEADVIEQEEARLTASERTYIHQIQAKEKQFHHELQHRRNTPDSIKTNLQCETIEDALGHWLPLAQQAEGYHGEQHENGWRFVAGQSQQYAMKTSQFLTEFKPFVELAANSGVYGALATGTLCAFFAIAQSKSTTEDVIRCAIEDVQDRLPGLKLLQQVHYEPGEHQARLRAKLLLARTAVIDLAIESSMYYLRSGARRWWQATFEPDRFNGLLDTVKKHVMTVRELCEQLIAVNVSNIRRQNDQLLQGNQDLQAGNQNLQAGNQDLQAKVDRLLLDNQNLQAQVSRLQSDNKNASLSRLQETLGLVDWSEEKHQQGFVEHRRSLERAAASNRLLQWMYSDRLLEYERHGLLSWASSSSPSTLLIVGANHASSSRKYHCWMSPLAIRVINALRSKSEKLAFYILDDNERTSINTVMPVVLLQLLRLQWDSLPESSDVLAKCQAYRDAVTNRSRVLAKEALNEVAQTIVRSFAKDQKVTIVLDRVDRCERRDQLALLESLVQMTEGAKCCLKILAIANQTLWDVEEDSIACASFEYRIERQQPLRGGR